MQTLIIIDMQPYFLKNNPALPGVLKAIDNAQKYNQPILVVEYRKCGKTSKEILNKLKNTNHKIIKKADDDGSVEIIHALNKFSFPKKLRICGTFADACVASTINGLIYDGMNPNNISVIKNALTFCIENNVEPYYTKWSKKGVTVKRT